MCRNGRNAKKRIVELKKKGAALLLGLTHTLCPLSTVRHRTVFGVHGESYRRFDLIESFANGLSAWVLENFSVREKSLSFLTASAA